GELGGSELPPPCPLPRRTDNRPVLDFDRLNAPPPSHCKPKYTSTPSTNAANSARHSADIPKEASSKLSLIFTKKNRESKCGHVVGATIAKMTATSGLAPSSENNMPQAMASSAPTSQRPNLPESMPASGH